MPGIGTEIWELGVCGENGWQGSGARGRPDSGCAGKRLMGGTGIGELGSGVVRGNGWQGSGVGGQGSAGLGYRAETRTRKWLSCLVFPARLGCAGKRSLGFSLTTLYSWAHFSNASALIRATGVCGETICSFFSWHAAVARHVATNSRGLRPKRAHRALNYRYGGQASRACRAGVLAGPIYRPKA